MPRYAFLIGLVGLVAISTVSAIVPYPYGVVDG